MTIRNKFFTRFPSGKARLISAMVITLSLCLLGTELLLGQTTVTFTTVGQDTWPVPAGVTSIEIKAWGAQGGAYSSGTPGSGGYAEGTLAVTPGEVLYIYVGGKGLGTNTAGGFNGGGSTVSYGGSGGGASDVRQGGSALTNRKIVAGGGGGTGYSTSTPGGNGGGTSGSAGGAGSCTTGGGGGTQISGGAVGTGCTGGSSGSLGQGGGGSNGGGGGGGYYGGGSGQGGSTDSGGGGGSGYIGGVTGGSMSVGVNNGNVNSGNGYVEITYTTTCSGSGPAAALNFDGSDDYVTLNTSPTVTAPYTVEFWAKPESTGVCAVMGSRAGGTNNTFDVKFQNGNSIHADIGNGSSWLTTGADASLSYSTGTWYHIAYVVTTTGYTIYINGTQYGSGTFSGTPLLCNSTNRLALGAYSSSGGECFNGDIDEVRVWNYARTQAQIQAYKDCEINAAMTGLVANYHFNQGTVCANNAGTTSLSDASGNGYTGTLNNFALTGATSNWTSPGGVTSGNNCTINYCDGAINIPSAPVVNQSLSCTNVPYPGNLNATTVSAVCGNASNSYKGGGEAIYTFTPSSTGSYTISYSGQTWVGIFVYSGSCPTTGTCVGSAAAGSATTVSLNVSLTAGTLYYIWFDTYPSPNSPCPGTFSISSLSASDPCASATPMACGTTYSGSIAASDPNTISTCATRAGGERVYSFTPSTTGSHTFNYEQTSGDPDFFLTDVCGAAGSFCERTNADSGTESYTRVLTAGVTYYVIVQNNSGASNFNVSVDCSTPVSPCTPSFSSTTDYITNFSLGSINNSTGFSTGGYGNYTGQSTNLNAGATVNASLTSSSGSGTHAAAIWIDFNDNGVFEASERVGTMDNIDPSTTVSIPITIPSSAPVGSHVLRVVYRYNEQAINIHPCVSGAFGEGEDYKIVVETSPCSSIQTMQCGVTYNATLYPNSGAWTNYTGASLSWPGSEKVWAFTAPTTGSYTFNLNEGSADADFFLMSACDPNSTNLSNGYWYGGSSGSSNTVTLTGGVTYYLIADLYSPNSSTTVTVSVDCSTPSPDIIYGSDNCDDAMAFCADETETSVTFATTDVESPYPAGQCSYMRNPTWWYMQISEAGNIDITIASSCGDVDFACFGPFNNHTCDATLLTNSTSSTYFSGSSLAQYHSTYNPNNESTSSSTDVPFCTTGALATPSGNLVDFGGSTSDTEYLQLRNTQVGEYYVVLIGNFAQCAGNISFTQTNISQPGAGASDCNIVTPCNITSITANTVCNAGGTYTVSGNINFTDPPVDGTLTICDGTNCQTFYHPFTSPTAYSLSGITVDGTLHTLEANFVSSTVNCDKIANYNSPSLSTIALTSASGTNAQTVCSGIAITNITYSTTGATGATFTGLPSGITGSYSGGNITISGTATVSTTTTYNYTITLTGSCGVVTENGSITITPGIVPTFTQVGPYCSGASIPALPTTSNNSVTGTWAPAINNTTTTTYTFTPNSGQCASNANMVITITNPSNSGLTNGDYVWSGNTNSNWETASNWLVYDGTGFAVASVIPSIANNVFIRASGTCFTSSPAVNTSVVATCKNLTIDNSNTLYLNASSNLNIDGSLYNHGTIQTTGSSTIQISGNWNNSGTFSPGTGTVIFSGSSGISTIYTGGAEIGKQFHNVIINSSSTVNLGGDVRINNDFTISITIPNIGFNCQTYTMSVGGNWARLSGLFNRGTGSVSLTGSAKDIAGEHTIFRNLDISGMYTLTAPTLTCMRTAGVGGDLNIASGASLTAQSNTINVQGNWTNSGIYNAGSETVIFNGNLVQTIISGGSSFNNVVFNNTTAGINDINLNTPMTINGNATFTEGIVYYSGTGSLTFGNSATSNIGNANSYVKGIVAKTGTSTFNFAVGEGENWGPCAIAAPATNSTITAQYKHTAGPLNWSAAYMCAGSDLHHTSGVEHWLLTSNGSTPAVTLYWNDESGVVNSNELVVAHYDEANSCWENKGGSVSSNSVTSTIPFNGYSPISIGTLSSINPLPVELLSFTAECNNNSEVLLAWTTASEINNDYFEIQRSTQALSWEVIATVLGAGYSSSLLNYSYLDKDKPNTTIYYRLRQVDYDGTDKFSDIIQIRCENVMEKPVITVYPNPFNSNLNIEFENWDINYAEIELLDITSRIIKTWKLENAMTNFVYEVNLSNLNPAMYMLKIKTSSGVIMRKIEKQ